MARIPVNQDQPPERWDREMTPAPRSSYSPSEDLDIDWSMAGWVALAVIIFIVLVTVVGTVLPVILVVTA